MFTNKPVSGHLRHFLGVAETPATPPCPGRNIASLVRNCLFVHRDGLIISQLTLTIWRSAHYPVTDMEVCLSWACRVKDLHLKIFHRKFKTSSWHAGRGQPQIREETLFVTQARVFHRFSPFSNHRPYISTFSILFLPECGCRNPNQFA